MMKTRLAIRGDLLDFTAEPAWGETESAAVRFRPDHWLLIEDGRIAAVQAQAPGADWPRADHAGRLVLPGFIDTHVHSAQLEVIASYGSELLDWLNRYTFPAELAFAERAHADAAAEFFLDRLLENGTTTAAVFCTVHPQSVDAFFTASEARGLGMIAGKCLMDRHAPDGLTDTADTGYRDSKALIERWHGHARSRYAITPRFAPTSTLPQMQAMGQLAREHPDVYIQSHVAENRAEIAWVNELFPGHRSYLDVYDHYGLLRDRAIYAHCIHLDDADRARMTAAGATPSFCPTSNLFIGSGLYNLQQALDQYDSIVKVLSEEAAFARAACDNETFLALRKFLGEAQAALLNRAYNLPPLISYEFPGGVSSLVAPPRPISFHESPALMVNRSCTVIRSRPPRRSAPCSGYASRNGWSTRSAPRSTVMPTNRLTTLLLIDRMSWRSAGPNRVGLPRPSP